MITSRDRLPFAFEDLGEQQVKKHWPGRLRVYRVRDNPATAAKDLSVNRPLPLPDKPSIAVPAVPEHVGRPGAGILLQTGSLKTSPPALSKIRWFFCHRPQQQLHLQGPCP